MDEKLILEAHAFNSQIEERIKNGHIPDLRYTEDCDYFYNNVWRRRAYVQMDFGEIFQLISSSIESNARREKGDVRVLEVGCGPGFISLELARAGYNVIGLDLSPECINVAKTFADKDPHRNERGSLTYLSGDFFALEELEPCKFDVIVFVGALHHFADQGRVMSRVSQLLREAGLIIAHEPTRDRVTKQNAAFVHFLKVLLSLNNGFFEKHPMALNREVLEQSVQVTFQKMRYELDSGQKAQSVNDNEAGFSEMYPALTRNFRQIEFKERYAFFHEIIGGLRFSEDANVSLARYLKAIDEYFCELGLLHPAEFYFVGAKK